MEDLKKYYKDYPWVFWIIGIFVAFVGVKILFSLVLTAMAYAFKYMSYLLLADVLKDVL